MSEPRRMENVKRPLASMSELLHQTSDAFLKRQAAWTALRALARIQYDHRPDTKQREVAPKTTYVIQPRAGSSFIPDVITYRTVTVHEPHPVQEGFITSRVVESKEPLKEDSLFEAESCDTSLGELEDDDMFLIYRTGQREITEEEDETRKWRRWRAANGRVPSIKKRKARLGTYITDTVYYEVTIPASQLDEVAVVEIRDGEPFSYWPPREEATVALTGIAEAAL